MKAAVAAAATSAKTASNLVTIASKYTGPLARWKSDIRLPRLPNAQRRTNPGCGSGSSPSAPCSRCWRPRRRARPRRCCPRTTRPPTWRPTTAAATSAPGGPTSSACRASATTSTRPRTPKAHQPELAGGTLAQHQLGNDHIVADAFNDGYTQFWSQDREPQWANLYQADSRHYWGGYGYLNLNGRVISTNAVDAPSVPDRFFGVGYHARRLQAAGLDVTEQVYAPFGDDPLLLHDVTIKNT